MSDKLVFEKQKAVSIVHDMHGQLLEKLTGNATIQERDTWPIKESSARAFINGSASPANIALLTAEAELSGSTVEDLANAIVAKADLFMLLVGKAGGLRVSALKSIDACTTEEEVELTLKGIEIKAAEEVAAFISGV